jgi:predicted nucleotidyltransferase
MIASELLRHSESAIVFGSYSSYSYGKTSDLDIVLLGNCDKEGIEKTKQKQIIQISEHCISYDEFSKTLKSKNPLAIEILKNHTIFGNVSKVVGIFMEATS